MTDPGDNRSLDALGARINQARRDAGLETEDRKDEAPPPSEVRMAWRISIEIVVALFLSTLLGWVFDQWFGTTPWLMLVFLFLGAGAGIANAVKTMNRMDALAAERALGETTRSGDAEGSSAGGSDETKAGGQGGG